jgi:hypothetical protein
MRQSDLSAYQRFCSLDVTLTQKIVCVSIHTQTVAHIRPVLWPSFKTCYLIERRSRSQSGRVEGLTAPSVLAGHRHKVVHIICPLTGLFNAQNFGSDPNRQNIKGFTNLRGTPRNNNEQL